MKGVWSKCASTPSQNASIYTRDTLSLWHWTDRLSNVARLNAEMYNWLRYWGVFTLIQSICSWSPHRDERKNGVWVKACFALWAWSTKFTWTRHILYYTNSEISWWYWQIVLPGFVAYRFWLWYLVWVMHILVKFTIASKWLCTLRKVT